MPLTKLFKKHPPFVVLSAFVIPFLLWMMVFKDFNIHGDTYNYYHWIKYYLDGIAQGEYPMWNPFFYIPLVLNFFGISFNIGFCVYYVFYFFVGLLGFYFLASFIFNGKRVEYLAYLLFLFYYQ